MTKWIGHAFFFAGCLGAVAGALTVAPKPLPPSPHRGAHPAVEDQAGLAPPMPVYLFGEPWREISATRKGRLPLFVVARSFVCCHRPTGEVFTVPAGYVTDFASIPRAVRSLVPPDGPWAPAAIMHDYLYAVGEPARRKVADDVFLAMMTDMAVDNRHATVIYRAVRLGGAAGYGLKDDWLWADLGRFEPGVGPPKPKSAGSVTASGRCSDDTGQL